MGHLSKISQIIDLIFLLENGILLLSALNSVLVVESYFLVSLSPVPSNTDLPICHTCTFSSTLFYSWNDAICLAFTAMFFQQSFGKTTFILCFLVDRLVFLDQLRMSYFEIHKQRSIVENAIYSAGSFR